MQHAWTTQFLELTSSDFYSEADWSRFSDFCHEWFSAFFGSTYFQKSGIVTNFVYINFCEFAAKISMFMVYEDMMAWKSISICNNTAHEEMEKKWKKSSNNNKAIKTNKPKGKNSAFVVYTTHWLRR